MLSTSSIDQDIQEQLFLRLLQEKPKLNAFSPELARRWTFSPDHKKVTFTLRSDVFWSDGYPVTAEDVVFTFQKQKCPELGWIFQSEKSLIDSVVARNDSTVIFYYSRSYPYQLTDANEGLILPKHVLENLSPSEWKTTPFNQNPVTNGPYRVKRWVRQQAIELEANPLYFRKGFPKIKKVVFKIVADESIRLSQIQNGEIDILEGVSVRQVGRLQKRPAIHVASFPDMAFGFLGWNERNSLFRKTRVRRALVMAINRPMVVRNVFGHYAIPLNSPILPQNWAFCDTIRPFPYDPQKALHLLNAEGWKDSNGDGWLEKNGKPFRFELMTNYGNPVRRDLAVLLQAQFKKIGVDAQIQFYDWSVFLDRFREGSYDAVLSAWRVSSKLELRSFWHSESIWNGFNRFFYKNPKVDALIDSVEQISDPEKEKGLWWRLQSVIYRDQPVLFLYVPDRVIAYRDCLKKPDFHPLSTYYYLYRWEWKRGTDGRK
ncbi:MAG: hypothetical protein GXO76_03795 [Calditrichaeota bacterium]|nr:hypothetical protein [Calditrichota bacterium]